MISALEPVGRWTPRKKAEVLWALSRRLVTVEQLCAAHGLSADELQEWMRNQRLIGQEGLKVTRVKKCRAAARDMGLQI